MHIPDNILSTPVWATLDLVGMAGFGLVARHAGRDIEDSRIPLLGVMGAFVFAAQMINFPVGIGTSGHLVGGALLAYALGPSLAVITMTAILAVQAFVFQDGGILALGANVLNMGIAGVFAAWLPYQLWGGGRRRKWAIFAGGFLSVMVSGALALTELLLSELPLTRVIILWTVGFFAVNALLEGAITLAVLQAIERLNAHWIQRPATSRRATWTALAGFAVVLVAAGFMIASTAPDGVQRIAIATGVAVKPALHAPMADYELPVWSSYWIRRASAGLAGLVLIFGLSAAAAKLLARRRVVKEKEAACTT